MAAVFIAQATNTNLDLWHQIVLMAVLLLTSKGAAGVTGSGFIVLAATLSAVGTVPVAGLALILGVDRFMSEARALTNLIGNGVATLVGCAMDRRSECGADEPGADATRSCCRGGNTTVRECVVSSTRVAGCQILTGTIIQPHWRI